MKSIVLIVSLFGTSLLAEDAITFTNSEGTVISNAVVLSTNAVDVFYELPGGGGRAHLADLPPDLQRRFNYDPVAAQRAKAKKIHDDIDFAFKARDAAIAADRATRLQNIDAQIQKTRCIVCGRVIQKIKHNTVLPSGVSFTSDLGLLVNSGSEINYDALSWSGRDDIPGANGIVLLQGYTHAVDGEIVNVVAYPDGEYTYEAVSGAQKTVRRFQFHKDDVMTIATGHDMQLITNRSAAYH